MYFDNVFIILDRILLYLNILYKRNAEKGYPQHPTTITWGDRATRAPHVSFLVHVISEESIFLIGFCCIFACVL